MRKERLRKSPPVMCKSFSVFLCCQVFCACAGKVCTCVYFMCMRMSDTDERIKIFVKCTIYFHSTVFIAETIFIC